MIRVSGIVQEGARQARRYGYPTANVSVSGLEIDHGTYAAYVMIDDQQHNAAAYYGSWRPGIIEVHILDGECELYGREITVELLERVSGEVAFENAESMQKKIKEDIESARTYFDR